MADFKLWTFERFDATLTTSSVSESGASIVMEVSTEWQKRNGCVLEQRERRRKKNGCF